MKLRFDKGRWGASGTVHAGLRAATAAVHARVLEKMPYVFHGDPEYRQSKTYQEDYASALASMEKALRQGSHVDTYKEGYSVLVAVTMLSTPISGWWCLKTVSSS